MLIGDEMGLGKTLQAIALSIYYKSHWPLLIICPASLQNQWHNEFMKWGKPESSLYHIQFLTQQQLDMEPIKQKNRIYIMSFNLATTKTLPKFISQIDCLIVDESHYLKSDKAQRTRFLIPIIQRSTHSILLSGTASPSRPSELFTQLNALQPKIFSSFSAFGYRYCDGSSGNFKGASHLQELHTFLKSTVMIRRVKDDVLKDLPPKTRYCIKLHLQPNRLLQEQYEKFMGNQEMADLLDDPYDMMESCLNQKSTTKAMDSQIMEFFRKSGIAKKSLLKQYLNYIFKQFPDKKILFFGHHKAVLDSISSEYPSNFYIRIDGTTPKEQRHKEVQRFQTDESCRLGVLSILAAGTGLNLTAADTVIFGELYWNPGALCQAEDRAHRIGARGPVSVYYLLCDNTIDNFIWKKVNKKLEVTGLTLDGKFGELSGFVQEFKEDNVLDGELVDELCGDLNENEGDKEDQEPFVDDPGVLFPVDDVQEQEIDNLVFGEDEMNQKEGLQEEIVPVENNKRKIPTNSNPYQLIKKRKL
uniref:Uncharacterized protein n=1 Tax=Arcella intermedia TaxID=1963864 RepID=A0A6B2L0Z7_9EUKA